MEISKTEKREKPNLPHDENEKRIENHIKAAIHHEEAAKHHYDAVKHHRSGDHKKATESSIKANGHHALAVESLREDVKPQHLTN